VIDVDVVQADGLVAQTDLAVAGLGQVDLLGLENVGAAVVVNADGQGHARGAF
jgi:hypothetical protein